ncbi:hypothetical protein D3C77_333430 [compost metagenome]
MKKRSLPVEAALYKTKCSPAQQRMLGKLLILHGANRFVGKYPPCLTTSPLQIGQHEPGHIGGRAAHAASGLRHIFKSPLLVFFLNKAIGPSHIGLQLCRERLAKAAMFHPQRGKNMLFDIVREGLTRYSLNNVPGQSCAVVGIGRYLSWRECPLRHIGLQIIGKGKLLLLFQPENSVWIILESGGMRHQMS